MPIRSGVRRASTGELLKLGIKISQATVAKYMLRRQHSPSPTWRSFLRNQALGIAAIDMFIVPSATFRLLFVMLILAHDRRKDCPLRCYTASDRGLAVASVNRSVSLGYGSSLSAPRSRLIVRHRVQQAGRRDGNLGAPHCSALTVAESLRRAGHRLDPAGVSGPPHCLQPTPFAARPFVLHGLLSPHPDPSIARQGLSALASGPAAEERPSHRAPASRWVAPSLRTPRRLTNPIATCSWSRSGSGRSARSGDCACTTVEDLDNKTAANAFRTLFVGLGL